MLGSRYIKGEKPNTWISQEFSPKTRERENKGINNGVRFDYQIADELVAILKAHDEVYMKTYCDDEFINTYGQGKVFVADNEVVQASRRNIVNTFAMQKLKTA